MGGQHARTLDLLLARGGPAPDDIFPGKVDHRVHAVERFFRRLQERGIPFEKFAMDGNADGRGGRVARENDNPVPCFLELQEHRVADKSGGAGDEYFHLHNLRWDSPLIRFCTHLGLSSARRFFKI